METRDIPIVELSELEIRVAQNTQVFEHWLSLRGTARMPKWSDFDPLDIAGPLSNCIIVRLEEDDRYVVSLFGSTLVERFGAERTGKEVREVFDEDEIEPVLERLRIISGRPAVICLLSQMQTVGASSIVVEFLGLPFANESGEVDHVLFSVFFVDRNFQHDDKFDGEVPARRLIDGRIAPLR